MGLKAIIADIAAAVTGGVTVRDVRGDSGGGVNVTGPQFGPPGDDSQALPEDYALMVRADETSGEYDTVGFVDAQNAPVTDPGEKRIYARNQVTGAVVASMYLQNDGTVVIENAVGSVTVAPTGFVEVNGATITPTGDVWAAAGPGLVVSLLLHVHPSIGAPPTPIPTPP